MKNNSTHTNQNEALDGVAVSSGAKYLVLGVLGVVGYFKAKSWYDDYKLKQENTKAAEDNSTNIASQIHAENRATYTEDSVQIGLYRQITDYKKTKEAYNNVSGGKDMLEDTRKHVSSGAYQQILNIIGIKGGAVQATSQTSQEVTNTKKVFPWVVAKVDTRIRKSPKAGSAVFTLRPNIIGVAKANTIVGIIDKATLQKNGGKLFYDDANNAFFVPILIFNNRDVRKYYPAFVAASAINVFEKQPKNLHLFLISEFAYTQAYATSGVDTETTATTLNPLL